MAARAAALWLAWFAVPQWTAALQVTPGSPCSEFCIDDKDSNPKSSRIDGDDVVCNDFEFSSDKAGKKFQRCMTCLQESDFAKGAESDLDWFLYNLRYSFDYCVFGDMDAAEVDANPCATSEGCGKLSDVLRKGMVNSTTDREQYGYCEAEDQAMSGDTFDSCLACVSAESTHSYLSNFLVALAIGCEQRPAPGDLLGLNETVFTKNTIQAVNPNDMDSDGSNGLILPITAIVGISVGGLVLVLLGLGCGYMQYRKRKNRQRASGWSFRCQARSGSLPSRELNDDEKLKTWTSPSESHVTGLFPAPPQSTMSDTKSAKEHVTAIVTNVPPWPPLSTSGHGFHSSPSHDDRATPSSAASIRSTRPLLRNDSPASYSARSISGNYGQAVTTNRGSASPQPAIPVWDELQQQRMFSSPRTLTGSPAMGRQAEMQNFSSTTFPPPPRG